jgi:hypothetical protein
MVTGIIFGPVEIETQLFSQSFVGALLFQQGNHVNRQVRVLDCVRLQKRLSSTITMNPASASSLNTLSAKVREQGISSSA